MMVLVLLLLASAAPSRGQRHLRGEKGIEMQLGFTDGFRLAGDNAGLWATVATVANIRNRTYLKIAGHYTRKQYLIANRSEQSALVPLEQFVLEPMMYFNLAQSARRGLYLNAGLGGFGGYETLNGGSSQLSSGGELKAASAWIYGPVGGVEAEVYLSPRLVGLASVRERFHNTSEVAKFRFHAGIGIKFLLL